MICSPSGRGIKALLADIFWLWQSALKKSEKSEKTVHGTDDVWDFEWLQDAATAFDYVMRKKKHDGKTWEINVTVFTDKAISVRWHRIVGCHYSKCFTLRYSSRLELSWLPWRVGLQHLFALSIPWVLRHYLRCLPPCFLDLSSSPRSTNMHSLKEILPLQWRTKLSNFVRLCI